MASKGLSMPPPSSSARDSEPRTTDYGLRTRAADPIVLSTRDLSVWYGSALALKDITIDIPKPISVNEGQMSPYVVLTSTVVSQ